MRLPKKGWPVSLVSTASVGPGESVDFSADALRNMTHGPVTLYGLRWLIDCPTGPAPTPLNAAPNTLQNVATGNAAKLSLRLGDHIITAQPTPLYCLGRAWGQSVEQVQAIQGFNVVSGNFLTPNGSFASGIWKFDRPMRLDPGETLNAQAIGDPVISSPLNVSLAFVGRVEGGRGRRSIPYVASWNPPAFDPTVPTATVPVIVTSTERDLVNITGGPIQVSRFVGRLLRSINPAAAVGAVIQDVVPFIWDWIADPWDGTTDYYVGITADNSLTVSMRDSKGNSNVPVEVPFRQVFEPVGRSWECPHLLNDREYYIIQLTLNPENTIANLDVSVQPAISMVGHREVAA